MSNSEHMDISNSISDNKELQECEISRKDVHLMFDRIAHRYDFLNHFLSVNFDKKWRKLASRQLPHQDHLNVLDIATGTGDQLISHILINNISKAVGVDPSKEMLKFGREKIKALNPKSKVDLLEGSAESLTFEDNSFDAVSISFGIRNVVDVDQSLSEMYRVLKLNGKVIILEFSIPENFIIKPLYLFYFRKILPKLGSMISGDAKAYSYLNRTAETFLSGDAFLSNLTKIGFKDVKQTKLTFGIASIYSGIKR